MAEKDTASKRRHNISLILAAAIGLAIPFFYAHYWMVLFTPGPEWEASPQNLIILIDVMWTEEEDYNHLPLVQIRGNGDMLWVEPDPQGGRRVFEGHLSRQEMDAIIRQLIEMSFFKKDIQHPPEGGLWLTVWLSETSRSRMLDPENARLYDLAGYLRSGAGTQGKEYIPTTGTLVAIPIEEVDLPLDTPADYTWPDERFGYGLDSVAENSQDREITGQELALAWEIVNSPTPVVESKGHRYWIAVRMPEMFQ